MNPTHDPARMTALHGQAENALGVAADSGAIARFPKLSAPKNPRNWRFFHS